jgi:putative ABC transport system substrate-binding protein
MRRREFITLVGAAAAWPLAVRAQQPAMAVVEYLSQNSAGADGSSRVPGFKQGLSQTGYVEGQNVTIEYRYLEGRFDRLPALAEDVIRRKPTAIMASGPSCTERSHGDDPYLPLWKGSLRSERRFAR